LRRLTAEAAAQLAGLKAVRIGASGPQNSLEGSQSLTVSDLRPGNAVVIATLNGNAEGSGTTVTAVAVLSGVEPLLKRSAEEQKEVLGSWNLTLDPEVSNDRGGQQ
jgi:UDP-N-acetylglucosamine enolpyruvyl transferase